MGQLEEHYIVVNKPENVDKWGMIVTMKKVEEPPFWGLCKHEIVKLDQSSIVYVEESNKVKTCYFTKKMDLNTIEKIVCLFGRHQHNEIKSHISR